VSKFFRIALKSMAIIAGFLILLLLFINLPFSKKIVTRQVNSLFNKLELPMQIHSIEKTGLRKVRVEGFSITDPHGDTIIYAGKVRANYHLLALTRSQVKLDNARLSQISVKLLRNEENETLSIAEAFKKGKKKKPVDPGKKKSKWEISIHKGDLSAIYFLMEDPVSGIHIRQEVDELLLKKFLVSLQGKGITAHTLELGKVDGYIKLTPNQLLKEKEKKNAGSPWNFGTQRLTMKDIDFTFEQAVDSLLLNLILEKGVIKTNQLNIPEKIIDVDEITLDGAVAGIYTGTGARNGEKSSTAAGKDFQWDIKTAKLDLENIDLSTGDYSFLPADSSHRGTRFEDLEMRLRDFRMSMGDVGMKLKKLAFESDNGFSLKELQAELESGSESTSLDLALETGSSRLRMEAEAQEAFFKLFEDPSGISEANVRIPNSMISLMDLSSFSPHIKEIPVFPLLAKESLDLVVQIEKKKNKYTVSELLISQERNFKLTLEGNAQNPFDTALARSRVELEISKINTPWLKEVLSASGFETAIPDSTLLSLETTIQNIFTSPELKLLLSLNQGNIDVNGMMDYHAKSYDLNSNFNQIQLGEIMDSPELGSFSGSLEIAGSGFSLETLESDLSLRIDSLRYGAYDYTRTSITGTLEPGNYRANIQAEDPSARGNLEISFSQSDSILKATAAGTLFAQLDQLNLFNDSLAVESNLTASFIKDRDSIESNVYLTDVKLTSPQDHAELNQVQASFQSNSEKTTLTGVSDFFNVDFQVGIPIEEIDRLGESGAKYLQSFVDPEDSIAGARLSNLSEIHAHGRIDYHNSLGMVLEEPAFYFGELDFSLYHHYDENQLRYHISGNDIEFASARAGWLDINLIDSAGIMDLSIHADRSSFFSEPVNTIIIKGQFAPRRSLTELTVLDSLGHTTYNFELSSEIDSNQMVLKIPSGKILMNQESWLMESSEMLRIDLNTKILSPDLKMIKDSSYLYIRNNMEEGFNTYLLDLKQVNLATVLPRDLFPGEPGGIISGSFEYAQSGQDQKKVSTDLDLINARFSDLKYDEVLLKGIYTFGDSGDYELDLYARLDSAEVKVDGRITDSLNREIQGNFSKIPLNTLQPFTEEILSDMGGYISGDVHISDKESIRKMGGQLMFKDAKLKVKTLNSFFRIPDQSISFRDKQLIFNNFRVLDSLGKPLIVDGNLDFGDNKPVTADLNISSSKLQIMNRGEQDNKSFYGRIFVDSEFSVEGPVNQPSVDGRILLSNNTEVFYNQKDDLSLTDSERTVNFVSHSQEDQEPLKPPISGRPAFTESSIRTIVEIDPSTILNFNLTKRIYNVELKVQGGGLLNYSMLNNNQISLSGNFEINDGDAVLKLVGWPDKAFTISEGSFVRWDGRAENPQLDLEAFNTVTTSYMNPVDGKTREVDINVLLKLSNYLADLDILLTINTPDQYLMSIINTMSPEEQMRQAFTILLFEIIDMPGISSSNDYVTQQVNQILASQMNQLTASTIQGIQISFGLDTYTQANQGGEESSTSLSYEVKKSLLNNRAEIEVSGRVNNKNEQAGAQDVSLNNVSFAYRLDSASTKYLKVYNERTYEDVFEGEVIKTGIGFTYRKRYRTFRDIWRRKDQNKKKEKGGK